jgi:hypothetical protein
MVDILFTLVHYTYISNTKQENEIMTYKNSDITKTTYSANNKYQKDDFDIEWEQKNKKYHGHVEGYWVISVIDGKKYFSPQKVFLYGRYDKNKSSKFAKMGEKGKAHALKQANRTSAEKEKIQREKEERYTIDNPLSEDYNYYDTIAYKRLRGEYDYDDVGEPGQ